MTSHYIERKSGGWVRAYLNMATEGLAIYLKYQFSTYEGVAIVYCFMDWNLWCLCLKLSALIATLTKQLHFYHKAPTNIC